MSWRIIKQEGRGYVITNDVDVIDWVFPEDLKNYGLKTIEEELDNFGKEDLV